jgi:hypothetical protein
MAGHFLLIMFLLSLTPPFIVHSQKNNQLGLLSLDSLFITFLVRVWYHGRYVRITVIQRYFPATYVWYHGT